MHYKAPIVIFANNGKKIEITDKIALKIVKKKEDNARTEYSGAWESHFLIRKMEAKPYKI